ncbi:unnamed protein product [Adineta steineri]|uniref:C2H2-type domain-containing protein n=1 Tax=Adineta steineri TaxID=433720 RepID=A0A813VDB6_9BILA|nr:unnamed protein product [Adineta steineri]
MMESTNSTNDQQTPPIVPINNSSSRRKQSKPNRLEHAVLENSSNVNVTGDLVNSTSILPSSITQYHVAAEQQDIGIGDDECDRISLNCEDGSLSSQSTGEQYNTDDVINRSTITSTNENGETILNEEEQINTNNNNNETTSGVLDFSFKIDNTNEHLLNSTNRSRSLNTSNKSRSLKRKHPNGNIDNGGAISMLNRVFHADAFCGICRKEFCNKYFLKTHLANKHGIFDQSVVPSISTSSTEITDAINDTNLQHPFTVISTLLNNDHDDLISSSPSPSSDMIQNNHHEHDNEFSSLRHQMNGVIAGDDDINHNNNNNNNNNTHTEDENDDDDEQDGSSSNPLMNLPQQIATILRNDNTNLYTIKTDDDQRVITSNSPTNNLDFQTSTTNLSRQSSTKILEDFCDICQKHFCNKYYLRKHKLDVHGVQTDCNIKPYKRIDNNTLSTKNSPPSSSSSSTQQIAPSIQLSSSFPNVTFKPSSVQQSLGMLLNPIFSPLVQQQQSSNTNEQQNLLTNKRRYTDSSNESSSSKSQYISSDVANVFANQLVTNNSKSQISTCTLCGKKFQSNDYLQLHLMNKHQIKTDIQQRATKLSNLITTSNESLNSNTYKKIKLEPNETTTTTTSVIKTPSSTASSSIDTIASPNTSTVIPGIVDTYFAAKMADRVSCDICHKQVCNKYFLKTHKLKVHGIGPDPVVTSSNNPETIDDENELQQQHSIDNSPPQLVVDEISTEPGVIPSPDALTASVNNFIGTNNDSNEQLSAIICDLCSKTFPSKFLLHIHMTNVHGIQQSNTLSSGATTTTTTLTNNTINNNINNQLINAGIKKPLTNGNNTVRLKQTPQVQLRVTCQVCKKELCNKYFLRAHMRNVHNISVDDLRLIQPPPSSTSQSSPNSDKQSSTKQIFSSSSNILSPTSSIPTDIHLNSTKYSLSNDNDINNINGHLTDSNEAENISSSNDNNNNNQLLSMQPFLVESDDDLYKDLFAPCMVYLPCRHRVTKPLEISLRLKPVDNTTTTD